MSFPDSLPSAGYSDEEPIQDLAALAPMAQMMTQDQLKDIIQCCLEDAVERSGLCSVALQTEDWAGIAKAAHDIKSMAGQIGARRLQGLAEALEDASKDSDTARVDDLVEALALATEYTLAAFAPERLDTIIVAARAID